LKLEKHAKERSEILRGHYIMTVGSYFRPEQLIFLDETAKDERTPCRQYGYSPRNQRAIKKVVYIRGMRYTLLPAMSLDGIIALDIMQGSCNKERFYNFILAKVVSLISLIFVFIKTKTNKFVLRVCITYAHTHIILVIASKHEPIPSK
jgi:hypothetical protein